MDDLPHEAQDLGGGAVEVGQVEQAGVVEAGEVQDLQRRLQFLGVGARLLAVRVPAAREEGEGLQPEGQGLGRSGPLGIEIHLAARQHSFQKPGEEATRRFIRRGLEAMHPDALAFGHGAGPGGQVGFADALLALEQDDAFHGDGGAEPEHERLQIGEFLAAPPQRPGDGLGQVPGLQPGLLFGQGRGRGRPGQEGRDFGQPPGGFSEDPRDLGEARPKGDDFGMQEPGMEILGELLGQVAQQGFALDFPPAGPEPRQRRSMEGLEVPGLLVVESEVAVNRVQSARIQEAGQEGIAHLIQVAVRG